MSNETRTKKYMCETCTQDIYSSQQPPPRRAPFSNHVCSFIPVPDVRCIPREIEVLSEGAIHPVELTLKDYIHANYICDDYDLPRGESPRMEEGEVQALFMLRCGDEIKLNNHLIRRIR